MNRNPPLQGTANQMAQYGRYGDTMMMHVNPAEVQGIAALSPTGSLTKNPVTGQPEAFLPMLLPLMASFGGSALATGAGASAIGAAVAGGLASGAATAAITGDLERGLVSGIMGAGMGAAVGAAGSAGADAATAGATEALTAAPDLTSGLVSSPGGFAGAAGADVAAQEALTSGLTSSPGGFAGAAGAVPPPEPSMLSSTFGSMDKLKETGYGNALKAPFKAPKGKGLMTEIMKPRSMLPMAIGAGQLGQMDAQEKFDKNNKAGDKKREADRREAYEDLQRGYRTAQPGALPGLSPYRNQMSSRTPPPMYMARGGRAGGMGGKPWWGGGNHPAPRQPEYVQGMARGGRAGGMGGKPWWGGGNHPDPRQPQYVQGMAPGGKTETPFPVDAGGSPRQPVGGSYFGDESLYTGQNNPFTGGAGNNAPNPGYGGIDPVTVQANLRGGANVSSQTPPGFMPGFNPEFDYFQNDPENVQYAPVTDSRDWGSMYRQNPIQRQQPTTPYFEPLGYRKPTAMDKVQGLYGAPIRGDKPSPMDKKSRKQNRYKYAEGGDVQLNAAMGPASVAPGGIAGIPTEQSQPQQPSEQDVQMLASALLGQSQQSDQIVEMFVQKYGPEIFQMVREMILQSVQPNAQTQGMIEGPGGGMDDQVEGTIGAEQPVAVSPGEYIVPADVVSGLGDGSSDAGASQLDAMSGNVRRARGGSTTQPNPIDPRAVMPA